MSSKPAGTLRVAPLSATQIVQSAASRTECGSEIFSPHAVPLCSNRGTRTERTGA